MPGLIARGWTGIKAKISTCSIGLRIPGETLDYAYERQIEQLSERQQGESPTSSPRRSAPQLE